MVEIIPSILTSDAKEAEELITACDGVVSRVQIDIVDGVFAENKTIEPINIKNLDVSLGYDFHLMVKDPINWVQKCVDAYADRIIGQVEMMTSQAEFVERVQSLGLRVGLAIDLGTPVSEIEPELLEIIDVALIMSVKAGFGGQKFDMSAISKIKELNDIRQKNRSAFRICIDGGETEDVVDDSYFAGADEVVVGRRLFKGDLLGNIKKMQKAAAN